MSWFIRPLKGKYYGTVVDIGRSTVTVWMPLGENYAASEREIAKGWEPDDGFDHVETQESYEAARLIAAAPNMLEALQALSNLYAFAWDRVDGGLTMMDSGVERFEAAHDLARAAIQKATT